MRKVFSVLLFICPLFAPAQDRAARYPQNYFRNPLDIPIYLAGNFGECRPGHFHSGIDIKTMGKEGQPVHSAADGYISRIKMEKSGFGHGIYITHPNGYTTVYGHLSTFAPAIQKYVHNQQYAQQRWDVDLQLSPDQFPVKKGQLIALSGNTGGSTAPHLHFEIREAKTEHPLNPELFGLPIKDKKAPVPLRAVIYNLDDGFYNCPHSNNMYSFGDGSYYCFRSSVELKSINGRYVTAKGTAISAPLFLDTSLIGIGLEVNDFMDGSDNTLAYYTADIYVNDTLSYTVTLDNIGYEETRYVNAFADYPTKKKEGYWVQCLFQLPGNRLNSIYTDPLHNRGLLQVKPAQVKHINIRIRDAFANTSIVAFDIKGEAYAEPVMKNNAAARTLYANAPNSFESNNLKFELNDRALYDSVTYLYNEQQDDKKLSAIYKICGAEIPLHTSMQLSIKPDKPVPFNLRDKMVMMYTDGKDEDGQAAASADMGWYKASVRSFGTYWLAADTVAPVIRSLQKDGANLNKAKEILFNVKDNMTSVRRFKALLDDKWICIEQHGDLFFYTFDEHCPAGKHKLVFTATDENSNTSTFAYTFTR